MSSALMTSAMRRAAVQSRAATYRGMSSASGADQFKEKWLSDKGAWPVIGVITGAVMFTTYWGLSTLLTNPDVRINKTSRTTILRPHKD